MFLTYDPLMSQIHSNIFLGALDHLLSLTMDPIEDIQTKIMVCLQKVKIFLIKEFN